MDKIFTVHANYVQQLQMLKYLVLIKETKFDDIPLIGFKTVHVTAADGTQKQLDHAVLMNKFRNSLIPKNEDFIFNQKKVLKSHLKGHIDPYYSLFCNNVTASHIFFHGSWIPTF